MFSSSAQRGSPVRADQRAPPGRWRGGEPPRAVMTRILKPKTLKPYTLKP